jgi:hypothetical protein
MDFFCWPSAGPMSKALKDMLIMEDVTGRDGTIYKGAFIDFSLVSIEDFLKAVEPNDVMIKQKSKVIFLDTGNFRSR